MTWAQGLMFAYVLGVPCVGLILESSPRLLILNDTLTLDLPASKSHILFAGLTAAKKMLARIHGAGEWTVQAWACAAADVKQLLA